MLTKIKREDCLNQYKIFPLRSYDFERDEENDFYPEVFKSYVLTLPSKTFKGHVKALGIEITRLIKAIDGDRLIFLGDTETPWLYQYNDYKPTKEAQEYLRANKVGNRFSGAIQVDTSELPTFIKHLAWLTRCNATLPYFHFVDSEQNILGNICKYGNLHLDTLNENSNKLVRIFLADSKFKYGDKNSCYNWFSKSSAIRGRQTIA
jgi:hypothetical protein